MKPFPALCAALLLSSVALRAEETAPAITPDQALSRLIEGNRRFVAGKALHPEQDAERRKLVAQGQHPVAIVLTCADSRVSPEIFLDQGIGNLFVIRNAGNVVDDHVLGSIEYAVEHLHVPLVLVVGHAKCGAVSAVVGGGEAPAHIHSIVDSIAPAVAEAKDETGDPVDKVVRANARHAAGQVAADEPILREAIREGKVKVVAARYDLESGEVSVLR